MSVYLGELKELDLFFDTVLIFLFLGDFILLNIAYIL